jgi:glucosamine--fructose-6-phosphate aminotransferase (isomerizing)
MCGIAAFAGTKQAEPFIAEALKRLEYRGYDGYGFLFVDEKNNWDLLRMSGYVSEYKVRNLPAKVGIGHTRWATHGEATVKNNHPVIDSKSGTVAVVHNGIVDNYEILKASLEEAGYVFNTCTDTEVIANLIHLTLSRHPIETHTHHEVACYIFAAIGQCLGNFSIAAILKDFPGFVACANHGMPVVVSPDGYIASDEAALVGFAEKCYQLDIDEIAVVDDSGLQIVNFLDSSFTLPLWKTINAVPEADYTHAMEREILEQPTLIKQHPIFEGYFSKLPERIILFGCGSSYNASLLGRFYLETIAQIPTEVEYASELLYRPLLQPEETLYIGVTQSGETADTLLAMERIAKAERSVIGLVNNNSCRASKSFQVVSLNVGKEIGVAATKTFTAECIFFLKLARRLASMKGIHIIRDCDELCDEILPVNMLDIMTPMQLEKLQSISKALSKYTNALYLARYYNYPIALEGALKLKEVSYIHAEAMPAAEMKHGPIALIDDKTVSLFIMTNQREPRLQSKVISNIQEIKARNGAVIAIVDPETAGSVWKLVDHYFCIPKTDAWLQPILANIPLQLLAYYTALELGHNVDRPRNLAKACTTD